MKLWLLSSAVIFAAGCSHGASNTKTSEAAPTKTPAPSAAKTEPTAAPEAKKSKHAAKAKKNEGTEASFDHTVCKSASDERMLDIVAKGGGCAVEYTKQSQKSEIASAEHETEHCKQVMQKVRGHLEGAGFTCN
jgi:hypothetical protein